MRPHTESVAVDDPRDEDEVVCTVWWASASSLRGDHSLLLNDVERSRADAFRNKAAGTRFTLAAVLLRVVAGTMLGVPPMAVAVDRTCSRCGAQHGRPHLARAGLEVSVAHSGDVAAVATADRVVVGVDVEEIRPIDYPGLLDDVCSAAERENVKDLTTFLRTWTRKESLLKATGDGLAVVLSDLVLAPGESSATLVRYPGREGLEATIRDVELRPGYVAAVTALTWRPLHVGVNPASALLARPVRRNRSGIDGHAARR